MANPLQRIQEQRAIRVLELLQGDIRAQIRLEGNHKNQKSEDRILKFTTADREVIWNRQVSPAYKGELIHSLPKTRDFWQRVDLSEFTKCQLEAVCDLLDLTRQGKKVELQARILDWLHEPEILAQAEMERQRRREEEEILASGKVLAVGHNFDGELGLGHREPVSGITEIESFRGRSIVEVFSGFEANFAFALAANGSVFTWGIGSSFLTNSAKNREIQKSENQDSRIKKKARGDTISSTSALISCCLFPREVSFLKNLNMTSIVSGRAYGHLALTAKDGSSYVWGRGECGELGNGEVTFTATEAPQRVLSLHAHVVSIGVGNSHTAAVTEQGKLYTWGGCWNGQLGLGESKRAGVQDKRLQSCFPSPTLVEMLSNVVITRVSCGAVHTAVISDSGALYTFGCGSGGRLGLGNNSDSYHPQLVTSLQKDRVVDVFCSRWHSLCIASPRNEHAETGAGWVYAFGSGLNGQLGLGKQKIAAVPSKSLKDKNYGALRIEISDTICFRRIARLPGLHQRQVLCKRITASSHHSCALTIDGKLFTWGRNRDGCLGRKTTEDDCFEPDLIETPSSWSFGPVTSVAAGDRFTIFTTGSWMGESRKAFDIQDQLNRRRKF